MADQAPDEPTSGEVETPAPTRRARLSILAVALVAYLLLACMVIAVAALLAVRYGHLR